MTDLAAWKSALADLSPTDQALCRSDILLYGTAFIKELDDGAKVRIDPLEIMDVDADVVRGWT